jgi:hypothetical protein
VTLSVAGSGRIISSPAGIACPNRCAATFRGRRSIRLVARPAPGWSFLGWGGDCKNRGACKLRADLNHLVNATFRKS